MFSIFKATKAVLTGVALGAFSAKVGKILLRNYGLVAQRKRLDKFVIMYQSNPILSTSNPHNLAVDYLKDQISLMDPTNSEHLRTATKYIRIAKHAHSVGEVDSYTLESLLERAKERLGLDVDNINPSAS